MNVKTYAIVIAATLLANGCQKEQVRQEAFFMEGQTPRDIERAIEVQAARGARHDGTLYKDHFDGPELNSLGRAKLDLMLRDSEAALPMVVYFELPAGDTQDRERRRSVIAYLTDTGLRPDQFRFEAGANPASVTPVAPALKNYDKTESTSDDGGDSKSGSSSGTPKK